MPAYRTAAIVAQFDGLEWSAIAVVIDDLCYPVGPGPLDLSPRLVDAGWLRLVSVPAFIAPSLRIAQQLCLSWAAQDGILLGAAKAIRVPTALLRASPQSPKFGPGAPTPPLLAVRIAH